MFFFQFLFPLSPFLSSPQLSQKRDQCLCALRSLLQKVAPPLCGCETTHRSLDLEKLSALQIARDNSRLEDTPHTWRLNSPLLEDLLFPFWWWKQGAQHLEVWRRAGGLRKQLTAFPQLQLLPSSPHWRETRQHSSPLLLLLLLLFLIQSHISQLPFHT